MNFFNLSKRGFPLGSSWYFWIKSWHVPQQNFQLNWKHCPSNDLEIELFYRKAFRFTQHLYEYYRDPNIRLEYDIQLSDIQSLLAILVLLEMTAVTLNTYRLAKSYHRWMFYRYHYLIHSIKMLDQNMIGFHQKNDRFTYAKIKTHRSTRTTMDMIQEMWSLSTKTWGVSSLLLITEALKSLLLSNHGLFNFIILTHTISWLNINSPVLYVFGVISLIMTVLNSLGTAIYRDGIPLYDHFLQADTNHQKLLKVGGRQLLTLIVVSVTMAWLPVSFGIKSLEIWPIYNLSWQASKLITRWIYYLNYGNSNPYSKSLALEQLQAEDFKPSEVALLACTLLGAIRKARYYPPSCHANVWGKIIAFLANYTPKSATYLERKQLMSSLSGPSFASNDIEKIKAAMLFFRVFVTNPVPNCEQAKQIDQLLVDPSHEQQEESLSHVFNHHRIDIYQLRKSIISSLNQQNTDLNLLYQQAKIYLERRKTLGSGQKNLDFFCRGLIRIFSCGCLASNNPFSLILSELGLRFDEKRFPETQFTETPEPTSASLSLPLLD